MTVLFVDVKGSMQLTEALDLETWHAVMDRFFGLVADAVHAFEGTINQFTGDGVMVLFGAPLAHEDHAQRACHAALRLREALVGFAAEVQAAHGVLFATRMGMHSGEVVVGSIGNDLRMDYTAQGHTVGLAARMEQLAPIGTIALTEHTAELVRGYFELRDLGRFDVKGARSRLRVYDLVGLGELRTRFDASRRRGLSRFVGRERELARLEELLADAAAGRGSALSLVGDAGIGKSRLCFEFVERCRARGVRVRTAQAVAHGRGVPFLALIDLLRRFFGLTDDDPADAVRRKVAAAALALDSALEPSLGLLYEFLGAGDPAESGAGLDPDERLRRLMDAVMGLVRASSRREPLVLVLEDLHWIDPGSEAFIARLVALAPETRLLVLLDHRPEYGASWLDDGSCRRLPLEPLADAAVEALLDHVLGRAAANERLRRAIRERAAGNPFFVEEVVQALIDAGRLAREDEAWLPTEPLERIEVPASLQAAIAARIDRLDEREKQVLQTAAVIGKCFPEALVQRATGLSSSACTLALAGLDETGFLTAVEGPGGREYAFHHPLTLEVAYNAQLDAPRARIHAAVAEALEAYQPGRLDDIAALIAHHAEEAGHPLDAARWHRRAAGWVGVRDVQAALRHWRAVTNLAEAAPDVPERDELRIHARVWMQQLAWRVGLSQEEAARVFSEGVALAEARGNREAVVMLALGNAIYRGVIGDEEGQYRYGSEAASVADDVGHDRLALAARVVMATSLHFQGRLQDAIEVADWAVAHRTEEPALEAQHFWISPYTYILGLRGLVYSQSGRAAAGGADLDRALELAGAIDDAETLACVHGFRVGHARCLGDAGAALHHGGRMFELAERTGIPLLRVDARITLGSALCEAGRHADALDVLDEALELIDALPILRGPRRRVLAGLAEAHLGCGNAARARHLAGQLLGADGSRSLLVELSCQLVLARALLAEEGALASGAVHRAIARAVDLLEKSGARGLEPQIHAVLAEAAEREGDPTRAARHRHAALHLGGAAPAAD